MIGVVSRFVAFALAVMRLVACGVPTVAHAIEFGDDFDFIGGSVLPSNAVYFA